MSLTSLAAEEIKRLELPHMTARSVRTGVQSVIDMAPMYSLPAAFVVDVVSQSAKKEALANEQQDQPSNALQSLVKYVPTESATLYVAATSAKDALMAAVPSFTPTFTYWFFAFLTPILFLVILAGKRRSAGLKALPRRISQWPWWRLFASFVAFSVWGLAVPTNPYSTSALKGAAFAFFAVFVSTLLSLLEGVIEPKKP